MRRLAITLLLCLWAIWVFANGDGPPGKPRPAMKARVTSPAAIGAQATSGDEVPLATGVLVLEYQLGPPGGDAIPSYFVVRCVKMDGPGTSERSIEAEPRAAPTYGAEMPLALLLPSPGPYQCVYAPWNEEIGEGPRAGPYAFRAT